MAEPFFFYLHNSLLLNSSPYYFFPLMCSVFCVLLFEVFGEVVALLLVEV